MPDDPIRSVLLVEDESVVALDIHHQLQNLGYEVLGPVDTGADAIAISADQPPDLVLMDIHLKGEMDGIEAAGRITGDHGVPVIFISAYSDRSSIDRAKRRSPSGYILKPFQERELAIAIELALYRHQAERELAAGRELLTRTVAAISDAVVTTDSDERIQFANAAANQLLGLSEGDVGTRFLDIVSFEEVPGLPGISNRRVFRSLDGGPVPVAVDRQSLSADGGEVWVIRDVSVQQAAEERLDQARRHAEQASRAKGEFLSRISHELRTPLNSIVGMTDLALETSDKEEQQEYLRMVKQSGTALDRLIGQILDVSRLESGRVELSPEQNEVAKVIGDAVKEVFHLAAEKSLPLYLNVDPSCHVEALFDSTRLSQIVMALVGNAIKFTNRGEVEVRASCGESAAPESQLVISVRDTGAGFDEQARADLFEPFEQADPILTRTSDGAGLGLTIVQRLVSLFGGDLTVESVAGEGSLFTVQLPIREMSSPRRFPSLDIEANVVTTSDAFHRAIENYAITLDSTVVSTTSSASITFVDAQSIDLAVSPRGSGAIAIANPVTAADIADLMRAKLPSGADCGLAGMRVLMVEDNRINRMLARRLLENAGCVVTEADSGTTALPILSVDSFDFVLMDIEMPGMNGYETARCIRGGGYGDPTVPIFVVSGHDPETEVDNLRAAGIDGQLPKPFDVSRIAELLIGRVSDKHQGCPDDTPDRQEVELDEFVDGVRSCVDKLDFLGVSSLCKALRTHRSGDARVTEMVFRIQLASRKEDAEQISKLLQMLGSRISESGKNR